MALFRLVAVSALAFNLYLGYHGGNWWTASLKDLESDMQQEKLIENVNYKENMSYFSKSCGEKYVFIDLIAFVLLIIT